MKNGWKKTTLGKLLDDRTCEQVATVLGKGGGARELMPILQQHEDELKAKNMDFRFLAYAIENGHGQWLLSSRTMNKEESK
jgi:hypothetical protein